MKKVIGIDIGGTKINGILFNGKKVIKELTIVTPNNLLEFERNLIKLVDFLSADVKIYGVGIGMAGLVDAKNGVVIHSPNIKFVRNLNLVKLFHINGIKIIKIDNDANCFTRAELMLGQGRSLRNFLGLTLGTGIGGGIVINSQLYRGSDNSGAELGHSLMDSEYTEAPFKRYRDSKDFAKSGKLIGRLLASLVNIFAPEGIIIGGGYGHNESPKYLALAKKEMAKHIFNKDHKTKILITKLKNAGALGAALLVK
jgi:glucokinase